jgi:probable selenium-dependent hydroxylase accessory protein YqeC
MLLRDALGVTRGEMVSLIGAGGKTTTLFRLAKELRDLGGKVMVTTTTKIFKPTKPHIDRLFIVEDVQALVDVCAEIAAPAIIGAGCAVNPEGKLLGMPTQWLDRLNRDGAFDAILVEADGAASRLLKIPADNEPVIPESCQATVWIVAIKILGKPLTDEWVHRAARARDLLGLPAEARVNEEVLLQLLQHKNGCLKGIPTASRKLALINQADSAAELAAAQALGEKLLRLNFAKAVITSYAGVEPIIRGIAD